MKKALLFFVLIFSILSGQAAPTTDTVTVTTQVGAPSKFAAITVKDNVTGNNVVATVTNIVIQNNDPSVATVSNPSGNTIRVVALSSGSGTANISCHISYTDPGDGLPKSEDKIIVVSYTVLAAPHGVNLALVFN